MVQTKKARHKHTYKESEKETERETNLKEIERRKHKVKERETMKDDEEMSNFKKRKRYMYMLASEKSTYTLVRQTDGLTDSLRQTNKEKRENFKGEINILWCLEIPKDEDKRMGNTVNNGPIEAEFV